MKKILLASIGVSAVAAYMSETVEVVHVTGADGKPVRVNKSDFDADQELPAKDRQYKLYSGDEQPEQSVAGGANATIPVPEGVALAAPSAPHFGAPGTPDAPIDPLKGAVAPTTATPDQLLVMKDGGKGKERFFVVDGTGNKITDRAPTIDPAGYATEDDAWKAIKDAPH